MDDSGWKIQKLTNESADKVEQFQKKVNVTLAQLRKKKSGIMLRPFQK
tara:strand:+ start:8610 stop:8753 length:144 start_codon:yes stop_codon:yes gene_type:complete